MTTMTKFLFPRRIYCCCSTCCCSSFRHYHHPHYHQQHQRHVWRKTVVFGIFIFSLYFALLSFVSFLAVSNHRSPAISRGPTAYISHHLTAKNGSLDLGLLSRLNGSIRGGGQDIGMITIEKSGSGSNTRYSLHSVSSSVGSRRDAGHANDIIRSQAIFKCLPLHYQEPPGLSVALASFPGSGNTWLRYLLQLSTGIFTGSVYKDFALLRNGFPGESMTNGRVLVVKTHESGSAARKQFQKAILLVRKPSEAILAEFNRRAAGHIGHAGRDKYTRNAGRYWSSFVAQKAKSWTETNLDWIEHFSGPLLITMYHQLVHNTTQELFTILHFLGEPITDGTLTCVLSNKEGIYRRRKKNIQFNPFTPKMEKFLSLQEKIVFDAIQRRIQSSSSSNNDIMSSKKLISISDGGGWDGGRKSTTIISSRTIKSKDKDYKEFKDYNGMKYFKDLEPSSPGVPPPLIEDSEFNTPLSVLLVSYQNNHNAKIHFNKPMLNSSTVKME